MSSFGMSASKVYANDFLGGNPAFWSVMQGGLDGTIEGLLHNNAGIIAAIKAKFAAPNDAAGRLKVVDLISRATASCIGQKLANQPLNPDSDTLSVLRVLEPGTDDALNAIINDNANTDVHNAFAQQSVNDIIHYITRQTGRGLFQAAMEKLVTVSTNPATILTSVVNLVKQLV